MAYITVLLSALVISRTDRSYSIVQSGSIIRGFNTKLFVIFIALVLSFIGGCRYYVGSDYSPYYADYKQYASIFYQRLISLDEPGVPLVFWIATLFKDDPAVCIFLAAALTVILLIRTFYKFSDDLCLSLILYVFVIWHTSFNGIRQALAVAVFFCAYASLKNKNLKAFFLVAFLAFLFHKSVVPFITLYFIVNRKVNKKNIIIMIAGTIVLLYSYARIYSFMGIVMDKEAYYLNYSATSTNYLSRSVNTLRVVFESFPAAFFLFKYKELTFYEIEKEKLDFNINLLVVHAAVALATSGSAYMARMSLYTMPFAVMAISTLMSYLKKDRQFFTFVFIVVFAFFGCYEVGHSARLIPFHWIWER